MKSDRGLTLVEVMAALLIFTIVIGSIYLLLEHGTRVWHETSEETNLRNQANTAMAYIQKSLTQAQTPPNGENAVRVSSSRLEIRTAWESVTPPVVSDQIVFEFRPDSTNHSVTRLYRGTLKNPSGTAVSLEDTNFAGSAFALSGNRILIHLELKGPRGHVYRLDASARYLLGQ
ncbi:PulJ/GspJ family protein [Effusibacillus consociatus]|uniref:Type II secretion system protein J n=1 Tax=Effusibacillus consociatus TaxID=1117041 RepID=A0ABV9Q101_9BACL